MLTNKHNYFFILTILISGLTFGCKPKSDTVLGYNYQIHESTGNKKGSPGDYVFFKFTVTSYSSDSVLAKMDTPPQLPVLQVPPADEVNLENPVAALLGRLSIGDSASILMPLDSIRQPGIDQELFKDGLNYNIKIVDVMTEEEYTADQAAKREEMIAEMKKDRERLPEIITLMDDNLEDFQKNKLNNIQEKDGLKYYILEEGEGDKPNQGDMIAVHYYGCLYNGTEFDSSFKKGQAMAYRLGVDRMVQGWEIGVPMLNRGTKAIFFIPSDLAYGAAGSPPNIPPNTDIAFYIELQEN